MKYPICKLENPESALRFDYGYDFEQKEMTCLYDI